MATPTKKLTAFLSNSGNYTHFAAGDTVIRFRTSSKLNKYTEVRKWDAGYLVVMADYETLGLTEEYIDLVSILKDLFFDVEKFINPIKEVKIRYD